MSQRLTILILSLLPLTLHAQWSNPEPLAEGCVATTLSCNATATGQLAPGDCSDPDGYYDVFRFRGTAGQFVEATVRALDDKLTDMFIGLRPPSGDGSRTPALYGNRAATVRYRLASTGDWLMVVRAGTVNGSGRYAVELKCINSSTTQPKDCVTQQMVCKQALTWEFTQSSCSFGPGRPYAQGEIYGQAGDLIRLQADTVGFQPLVGIYDANGKLLTQSFNPEFRRARLDYYIPTSGIYRLLVTNNADNGTGSFVLTTSCTTSGCVAPLFTRQPQDARATFGTNATVTFDVNSLGATTYEWTDITDFPSAVASTTTPSYTFTNVRTRRLYVVSAKTACGTTASRTFVVEPETGKRRAARH